MRHILRKWILAMALLLGLGVAAAADDEPFLQGDRAGFVVSELKYVLADDAEKTGACPQGMSRHVEEVFAATAEGKRRRSESDEAYAKRLHEGARKFSTASNGQNLCMNPEAGVPDPNFRTITNTTIPVGGLDLDGIDSRADTPTPGTCPHQDATGMDGERGIDNQFARVVGCSRSWQSTGSSNGFSIEMLTGSWGILLSLTGVEDLNNDPSIEVGIYANADPIQLSPTRVPLAYATYAMDQDPRFQARTKGRIRGGVLTTDPVDVRFHSVTNGMRFERPLLKARLQATVSKDGVLSGYLAGYTPVEAMYDVQFGYRSGRNAQGDLAPPGLRFGTGNGAARVLGYTCPGVYFALYEYADGNPDPQTGRCTSVSTQYQITAIPAFVVDVATESVNKALMKRSTDELN